MSVPLNRELELVEYRREVAGIYAAARDSRISPEERRERFRQARDRLFRCHPQSPLPSEEREDFTGLEYYPYHPAYRVLVSPSYDVRPEVFDIPLRDDGEFRMRRFARVTFTLQERLLALSLYWITGYGGGIFLPFCDATNGNTTYGGGRYLIDTIKHSDLGSENGKLVLDFNFAYHPSCVYAPVWHCPLAPAENTLKVAVEAGERLPPPRGSAGVGEGVRW